MILARHGETEFNVHYGQRRVDPGIEDPDLTERGRFQARELAARLGDLAPEIEHLVVSPYRRTLETAAIVNTGLGLPVRVETRVRERMGFACDVGSPPYRLSRAWPDLDFGTLSDGWWRPHDGGQEESEDALARRVANFRNEWALRADHTTALVVTHWGVIRSLTGITVGNTGIVHFDPTTGDFDVVHVGEGRGAGVVGASHP